MATAAVLSPHDVQTTLNYYKPSDEAPVMYAGVPPEGKPRSNIQFDPHAVLIHDVRGTEGTVSLDKTGFQFVKHESAEKDFLDEELIKTRYYKEVEDLLKKEAGAKRVFIFDHTIRRNYDSIGDPHEASRRGPAQAVHVDQTWEASINRVRRHLGADAERLLKSRVRIINVWRPIENPVAHNPLAVADYFSIDPNNDLISTRLVYDDYEGSTFGVKYSDAHRWYYLADQRPDEVTLIKCFDSDTDKARLTPHTAFLDTSSPTSAPKRKSIEVRCLVFDDE